MEIWKEVPGFEHYEISTLGTLRNKLTNKIVNGYVENTGYRSITLCKNGFHKRESFHRVVYLAFVGPIPENMEIAHLDGNNKNNALLNLKMVTPKENCYHRKIHGTESRGEKIGTSKLKEKDVIYIRDNPQKLSFNKLAKMFNVSSTAISYIVKRKSWAYL